MARPPRPSGHPVPALPNAEVVRRRASRGRDLSDHDGRRGHRSALREALDGVGAIHGVVTRPLGFRCLRETGGPVPLASGVVGSDEVATDIQYRFSYPYDGNIAPPLEVEHEGDFEPVTVHLAPAGDVGGAGWVGLLRCT